MLRQEGPAGIDTAYAYHDEKGVELFRKVRHEPADPDEPKRFTWLHNNGRQQGRGAHPPIPYRLDEIVRDTDSVIVMAEGEKCADFLATAGFLATSSRDLPASLPWFAGRTVVILPDNDKPGEKYAEAAARLVREAGGRAFIVPLPDLMNEGDDVCDWNGVPADLDRLIERTVSGASDADGLLPTLDLAALAAVKASPVQFAIERLAPIGEVTLFTGPGSAGKSLLAQQLCTVAAAGAGRCLGLNVATGPAIYVTCEDTSEHLHFRQERLCEALGIDMASLAGQLHLASLRGELGNELEACDRKGDYAPAPAYHRLAATIAATGAKIVALDNVAHLFAGNENDRHDVTRFVNLLNRLARDTGAAILLIGHPNKAGDSYSGSTAWLNAVRSQIWLDTPRNEDGCVPDRDARALTIGKANYAPQGNAISFRWHEWAFVSEGDLPPNVAAEMAANMAATHDNEVFLACLDERNRQERAVSESPASRTYAPKVFAEMAESKRIGRQRLQAAMDRLFRIGAIERGFIYREASEGKDRFGLRRVSADLSADVPLTGSADLPLTTRRPPPAHPPYTTYMEGGASEGSPPSDDPDDNGPR